MSAICHRTFILGWLVWMTQARRRQLWNMTLERTALGKQQPLTVTDAVLDSQSKRAAATATITRKPLKLFSRLMLALSSGALFGPAASRVNCGTSPHLPMPTRRHRLVQPPILSMSDRNPDNISFSMLSNSSNELKELIGFRGLQARDFQDPRDKKATAQLSVFVPIELVLRNIILPLLEDASFLNNIGRGVQVSKEQYPTIHRLVVEAAAQLDISVPDVFIKADPRPNAYTLAFQGKRPFIVIHTSLIDLMTLDEVKAVIGHELGHLKCEHSLWITVLNILALGTDIVDILVPLGLRQLISRQLTQWRRSAELSCDRASLLVTQNESVVMGVLMKLTGGSAKLAGEMSAEEFARQAKDYDDATGSSWLGRLVRYEDENQLYPLPILRAREIQKYAQSKEYHDLQTRLASKMQI